MQLDNDDGNDDQIATLITMASETRRDEWVRLEAQKRHDLLEAECSGALQIASLEELKENLHELTTLHAARAPFMRKLDPALDHVRSFANAITSASQYEPVACLVWGGIQAVFESAFTVSRMSEEVVDVIVELNLTLPEFDNYLALFPGGYELQWALQDMLDEFISYCVLAADYFRQGAARNWIINFLTSSPRANLQKTRSNIQRHIKSFRQAATLMHRREVRKQHLEVTKHLASSAMDAPDIEKQLPVKPPVNFPVSSVNYNKNYTFVGRDGILNDIHEVLQPTTGNTACCVLHGLPGSGKTQIALEYTYRNRKDYDAIFWLEAERGWTLDSTYARIADKLNLLEQKTEDPDGDKTQSLATQAALRWLQTTDRKWMLVFDNVEDMNDLNPYLPTDIVGSGSILVTTQNPSNYSITPIFKVFSVGALSREASAELLYIYLQRDPLDDEEEEVARQLGELVDGLPLAIATMGGYIHLSQESLSEFVQTLSQSSRPFQASALGPAAQYGKTLATVFDCALGELSKNARSLINILAFLNPDYIPEDIFDVSIEKGTLDFLRNKADLFDMIRELRRRQLIHRDVSGKKPYLSTHRTVQWNVLIHLSKDYENRWNVFQQAFRIVRDVLPEISPLQVPEADKWPLFHEYGPQILSLRTHCLWPEPPVKLPVDFAQILTDMGLYMWHTGKFPEGEEALNTAENILDDQNVNYDHPLRSDVYVILGVMSSFGGVSERKFSMDLRYKALKARQASYNAIPKAERTQNDEIRLFNTESDVAFGLVQAEKFKEAAAIMEKCLKQYKKWGPEKEIPFEYSKYFQIISHCQMADSKPIESIKSITHCVELLVDASEVQHPMTQLMKFCAAILCYHAGEVEKALEISESVLQMRKRIIGEFNHFTLESYTTCGRLLAHQGEYERARLYFDKCLERRKRATWNEEGVARAQFHFANVLEQLGEIEEAAKCREAASAVLQRFKKQFGDLLPTSEDDEVVLDQMVSLWAGRLTGELKQIKEFEPSDLDIAALKARNASNSSPLDIDLLSLDDASDSLHSLNVR